MGRTREAKVVCVRGKAEDEGRSFTFDDKKVDVFENMKWKERKFKPQVDEDEESERQRDVEC